MLWLVNYLFTIFANGRMITKPSTCSKPYVSLSNIGQFPKISIPNHGRLPCFIPPLPSEIPKCVTPPCPQNSIIVNPPSPSEFPFFWKYIFDLATPIWTNEHEFMPPQGCDLAAPGDKLSDSNLPLVDRLCKLLFRSEFGNKNKHH